MNNKQIPVVITDSEICIATELNYAREQIVVNIDLENIYCLRRFYNHLNAALMKHNKTKNINDIMEFSQEANEHTDKATFKLKVKMEINVDKGFNFIWKNITFEKGVEINFINFKNIAILSHNIFKDKVLLNNSAENPINLQNNTFHSFCKIYQNESKLDLSNSTFMKECNFVSLPSDRKSSGGIEFNNCKFGVAEGSCFFKNINFEDSISFKNSIFCGNTYFNNSIFKKYADFHECEFEKVACFYGATFEKVPNFSQAIFRENPNLVNTKLNFEFNDVRNSVQTNSHMADKSKAKSKDKHANDFRDSFRLLKNALIKDNNILDASQYHKNELYCKEIELDSKKPKCKILSCEWIDKILLGFYRITSDHHTDVLKSFHSLLIVIGIFGILSWLIIFAFNACRLDYLSLNPHALMENYNIHIKHFIAINNIFFVLMWNFILLLIFVASFALSVICERVRKLFTLFGYLVGIAFLIASPKYLIPASGLFTADRTILDPLSVVGGIYAILFAFMLYSFIKTIRKNSIIPS